MVTTRSQKTQEQPESAPPASIIFLVYAVLGLALSYAFGRDPGSLPAADEFVREVAPTTIVLCLFLTSYSLLDVMTVGAAKHRHGITSKTYGSSVLSPPEEVYLAQRAQTNQVEQLPGFIVASICFSVLVNGKVGAILSLIWATLRRLYATTYRASVGKPINKSGVTKFTIPAYFAVNAMLMGTVVHCVRFLLSK